VIPTLSAPAGYVMVYPVVVMPLTEIAPVIVGNVASGAGLTVNVAALEVTVVPPESVTTTLY
jgi:hypothetical protein